MPRADVSFERRGQILDAAAAVFSRGGIHQSRMEDIVAEAALSKGALYWYFKSKDELVAALIDRMLVDFLDALEKMVAKEGPLAERMPEIQRFVAEQIREVSGMRAVMLEFYALAGRDREVNRRVREHFARYLDLLTTLLKRGVESGDLGPIDPRMAAVTVAALYEGLALLWVIDPKAIDFPAGGEYALGLIIRGLKAKE